MRRKIIISLLALFTFFTVGAIIAALYVTNTSEELSRIVRLHQVENLRRALVISIQTVQSDLYAVHTPLAQKLDSIVHHVSSLEESARKCNACHHSPQLTKRINEIQILIQDYQTELSHYITASANKQRIETLGMEAASVGNRILVHTEEMSLTASEHLSQLTKDTMSKIRNVRVILFITLLSAFVLGFLVSVNLTRSITRPVNELVEATRVIASGSLGHEISYEGKTEFGELAKNFNAMSVALKEGYDSLEETNIELNKEIQERTRAEEKIEKAYRATRNILEKSPFGIYVVNERGEVEYVNPTMLVISGDEKNSFIGTNINQFPGYREYGISEKIKKALDGIPFFAGPIEYTSHLGNKTTIRNFIGIPLEEGDKNKALVFVEDVTDRIKLEEQLRHAQKMEAIGTLTGGLSHEFNNILTAIMGCSELFLDEIPENDPLREYPEMILASALKASNLTQSLLTYSRKHITKMDYVMISDVIRNINKIVAGLIGEDVELEVRNTGVEIVVMADRNQIEQVLMNLVSNARDAIPEGGKITIRSELIQIDETFIRANGFGRPGSYVRISVKDSGYGMDEKTREKIFEPFFTTKDVGKGTGLGLSMVYGIVEKHNGFIDVQSEPGQGAIFMIYLPSVKADMKMTEGEDRLYERGGKETILIAEDDDRVRMLLKTFLEKAGYKVIEAVDGDDAVDTFNYNSDTIDLVLCDVIMPKKNGKEIYDAITKTGRDVKVVFISGYTEKIIQEKGAVREGINFISKPVSKKVLLKTVRNVLDNNV
jgi:PAS domain S-box-containing protein